MIVNGQADILHDTMLEREITRIASEIDMVKRLAYDSIKTSEQRPQEAREHLSWACDALAHKLHLESELVKARNLQAEQDSYDNIFGGPGI